MLLLIVWADQARCRIQRCARNKSAAKGVDHSFAYIYCTSRRAKQKLMQNQSVGSGETVDTPAVFRANYAAEEGPTTKFGPTGGMNEAYET
jgi:hypothetical protein